MESQFPLFLVKGSMTRIVALAPTVTTGYRLGDDTFGREKHIHCSIHVLIRH